MILTIYTGFVTDDPFFNTEFYIFFAIMCVFYLSEVPGPNILSSLCFSGIIIHHLRNLPAADGETGSNPLPQHTDVPVCNIESGEMKSGRIHISEADDMLRTENGGRPPIQKEIRCLL